MIWCCPRCFGDLRVAIGSLRCENCSSEYDQVNGIPDLRVPQSGWMDFEEDLAQARALAADKTLSLEEMVRSVYASRPDWKTDRVELRTTQVLQAPHRLQRDVSEWLTPLLKPNDEVLDLGCGAGMLLAALARHGHQGFGIDVSMTWLVVAQRMITDWGGTPNLAAAVGEHLPLRDNAIDAIVSLDVIEHVTSPDLYLSEIYRSTRYGGSVVLTTPNRFSLTAEPHVKVWGVGWLPQPWQAPFVRWRSGKTYDDTRLMGSLGLARRIRKRTGFDFRIVTPSVPAEEIARFAAAKSVLARCYNWMCSFALLRPLFLMIGPFFRIEARKRSRREG